MATLLPGCTEASPGEGASGLTSAGRPLMPRDLKSENGKNYLLIVRLHMVSIEVPVGTVSDSEELWSYVDEEAVRQVRTPALGLNGLRIGLGRNDSWPDLAEVLKRMTGRRCEESTMIALPGNPVHIVLKSAQPAQTLFAFRKDLSLEGDDYPPGDNLLTIVCTLNRDDPSKLLLTGLPQIRTSRRKSRYVNRNGKIMLVSKPSVYSLTSLTFQAVVPSNDFLLIGPGGQSGRPSSIGHAFFVKDKEGVEFETVLILRPEVFAAPAAPPKPVRLKPTNSPS